MVLGSGAIARNADLLMRACVFESLRRGNSAVGSALRFFCSLNEVTHRQQRLATCEQLEYNFSVLADRTLAEDLGTVVRMQSEND